MEPEAYRTHRGDVPLRIGLGNVAAWLRHLGPPPGVGLFAHPEAVPVALGLARQVAGVPVFRDLRTPRDRLLLLPVSGAVFSRSSLPDRTDSPRSPAALRARCQAARIRPAELADWAEVDTRLLTRFLAGDGTLTDWTLSRVDRALREEEAGQAGYRWLLEQDARLRQSAQAA